MIWKAAAMLWQIGKKNWNKTSSVMPSSHNTSQLLISLYSEVKHRFEYSRLSVALLLGCTHRCRPSFSAEFPVVWWQKVAISLYLTHTPLSLGQEQKCPFIPIRSTVPPFACHNFGDCMQLLNIVNDLLCPNRGIDLALLRITQL